MPLNAHAGAPPDDIEFAELPTSIQLDGTASTAGVGSILEWKWTIRAKPPGSSVSLSADNVAQPMLQNLDMPGTVIVDLNVRDASGWAWVQAEPHAVPLAMATARVHIVAKTKNLGLRKPALGERTMRDHPTASLVEGDPGWTDAWAKQDEALDALDELAADVDEVSGQTPPRSVWIQATNGATDADGSMAKPFNPASAAAVGVPGPWQQAITALNGIVDASAAEEDQPRTIFVMGGAYAETVTVASKTSFNIMLLGEVFLAGAVSLGVVTPTHSEAHNRRIIVAPMNGGARLLVSSPGTLTLTNPNTRTATVVLERVSAVSLGESGNAGLTAELYNSVFNGNVSLTNTKIGTADRLLVLGSASAKSFGYCSALRVSGSITTTEAPTTVQVNGFFDCKFTGTPVFTGPAGTATFDLLTNASFVAQGGAYSGGAGVADHLATTVDANGNVRTSEAGEVRTHKVVGGDSADSATGLSLLAEGSILVQSSESNILVQTQGTGTTIGIDAEGDGSFNTGGELALAAGAAAGLQGGTALTLETLAGDASLTAADDLLLTAGDDVNIQCADILATATGTASITNGSNQLSMVAGTGQIDFKGASGAQFGTSVNNRVLVDQGAGTIQLQATGGVTGSRLRNGFDYQINAEDSKGQNTTAEVAFDSKATIPPNTLQLFDLIRIRLVIAVTNVAAGTDPTGRLRIGGLSGTELNSAFIRPVTDSFTEYLFEGRVAAIGASLSLVTASKWFYGYDESGSIDNQDRSSFAAGTVAGPATTSAIDVVGTIQFTATNILNIATIKSLLVEIIRGS